MYRYDLLLGSQPIQSLRLAFYEPLLELRKTGKRNKPDMQTSQQTNGGQKRKRTIEPTDANVLATRQVIASSARPRAKLRRCTPSASACTILLCVGH